VLKDLAPLVALALASTGVGGAYPANTFAVATAAVATPASGPPARSLLVRRDGAWVQFYLAKRG